MSVRLSFANVQPHTLFADHMVVQRNSTIPIWGWADPNEKITISASWGIEIQTTTLSDSTWRALLKTPDAGGPFQITIKGKNEVIIDDVLSGEVWLCSGQSNMDFHFSKLLNDAREKKYQPLVEELRNEVQHAGDDWIRHIEVPRNPSIHKKAKNFEAQWVNVDTSNIKNITAMGYYFAKKLREHIDVPIAIIECSWGGSRIQPWLPKSDYMSDPDMKEYFETNREKITELMSRYDEESYVDETYETKRAEWIAGGKKTNKPYPKIYPTKDKQVPATLYNGMISAIVPYTIKGIVWYQGESNSHFQEEKYGQYFTKLITSWRTDWGVEDMPFYWVQLAAYQVPDQRSDVGWATVNDQLRRSLKMPNTGMAVLHDIGEAKDVHPHNKMDAGARLALWPLVHDYGVNISTYSGPLFKKASVKKNKMIIEFDHAGSGLVTAQKELNNPPKEVNDQLTWFEIAGDDGEWKTATAIIKGKNKVIVSNEAILHPVKVRYAWSSNPEGANLYNKEGLPAAVFTSDY